MPKFFVSDDGGGRHRHRASCPSPRSRCRWPRRSSSAPTRNTCSAGARLVREYNCRGCHQIGEQGGSIREVVRSQIEAAGGEPSQALGALAAAALQRGGEDRRGRARAHRLAARVPGRPVERDPALVRPAHADLPLHRGGAEHAHPVLRRPGRRALPGRAAGRARSRRCSPPATSCSPSGSASSATWWRASCPTRSRPTWRPTSPRCRSACARSGSTTGWPTRSSIQPGTRMPANFPQGPAGERVPGDPGRRPGQADRRRARLPADPGAGPGRAAGHPARDPGLAGADARGQHSEPREQQPPGALTGEADERPRGLRPGGRAAGRGSVRRRRRSSARPASRSRDDGGRGARRPRLAAARARRHRRLARASRARRHAGAAGRPPRLQGVPLVILAYDADIDSYSGAITHGAAAYLVKPVDPERAGRRGPAARRGGERAATAPRSAGGCGGRC